jgi:predicted SAM-dependent methyltransferase
MIRGFAKHLYEKFVYLRLRILCKRTSPKIIIGAHVQAGLLLENGWISTSQRFLDMLKEEDWHGLFGNRKVGALLAEHVWEHLTPEEGMRAAVMCHKYLEPGGRLRVAVPDGYHPNPEYIQWVKPNGTGGGASDHKVLYTHESFSSLFAQAGFQVNLLEYFDKSGTFHAMNWSSREGHIHRSQSNDQRNIDGRLVYTSIILDARKI